ncbi:DUF2264 domain-containing protein [Enterococcus sp. DIV0876]|uniref:DUF2264 domain-containing protein n=1 Tax=Enterococcus sp. DIV0876 TaxID=2774633 RepID=UPI003D2FBCD8
MINKRIKSNPFEQYEEVAEGFNDMLTVLHPYFKAETAGGLDLGTHGSVYDKKIRDTEAFLRPLWGLGPFLTQNDSPFLAEYMQGIVAGTDPNHPNYWGVVQDFDQRIVEMASLSTLFLLNKEKTWLKLSPEQQKNVHAWLIQANDHEIPANNWHFFRILVNSAMKKCDMSYSQEQIDEDFALIETFYLGDGWYCDGVQTQIDYYVSFAIHYYSLLYYKLVPEDEARGQRFKERAVQFAKTFQYWFSATGAAVPFGRSLSYRFAQVSFFSALVFADVEALPWGEIKGIISRHLHHWMQQDIFTPEGLLSVGYYYQNLVFAEGYNAPGSPYWAFKTFLLLAVPKEHPYWQAKTQPLQVSENKHPHPISRNYYQYSSELAHALMFPAGQFIHNQSHASSKYSKFVSSSIFGNSVPKSNYWYYEGNFDNCLALSEDDHYFRTKELDHSYHIKSDRIIHEWFPWTDVHIRSTIIPLEGCHVRIHEVHAARSLYLYEGGFSTPQEDSEMVQKNGMASVENAIGYSKIESIIGFDESGVVRTEPNTNLFFPATLLPHLKVKKASGNYLLVSVVTGLLPDESVQPVDIKQSNGQLTIKQAEEQIVVALAGGKDEYEQGNK